MAFDRRQPYFPALLVTTGTYVCSNLTCVLRQCAGSGWKPANMAARYQKDMRDSSPDLKSLDPTYTILSPSEYASTRVATLKPRMDKAPNPFTLLAMLNTQQWLFFFVAFIAWSWDAFDFFTVSLTVSDLAETFDKSNTDITWGITLVLMFRSVGSTIFGIAADRYGRKW